MRTNDGQVIIATEPEGIVKELHKLSHTPSENDRRFMRDTSEMVQLQFGKKVRYGSPAKFVEDLLGIGLLIDDEEELLQ